MGRSVHDGTAQLLEFPVREPLVNNKRDPDGRTMLLSFSPPIEGDDSKLYEFGVACETNGIVDVFAMDTSRPGYILSQEDGYWVALINGTVLNGKQTIEDVLSDCGYSLLIGV